MTTTTRKRRAKATGTVQDDRVGRDVLDAYCATMEISVGRQGNVTPEMLAAARPGGSDNPDPSASGALAYLRQLERWHATGPEQPDARTALRWDAQAQADVAAAYAAEPIHVRLVNGHSVSVHPKGDVALRRLGWIDRALQWTIEEREKLEAQPTGAEQMEVLGLALRMETALEREYAEILCHPDAGMPWPDDGQWDHASLPWSEQLTGFDLASLRRAHLDVNLLRLQTITDRSRMLGGGKGEGSPLAAFLGVMAHELKVQPREMARHWSLGEVFAQALLKWESSERSRRESEKSSPTIP